MNPKLLSHGLDFEGQAVAGWWISEKLDGCRAFWDGATLWTRSGKRIDAPGWFTAPLPRMALDGEIYAGRGNLETARLATQYGGEHFTREVRFVAFDAPEVKAAYPQRLAAIPASQVQVVTTRPCAGMADLRAELSKVQSAGGEGLMLRHPSALYAPGRTATILKVKAL